MSKQVILHLTAVSYGGAGQYTMGIHQNMIRDGYDSYVCVNGEQLILPTNQTISVPHKRQSIYTRFKRFFIRYILPRTNGVAMKYAPYNLFEHLDLCDPHEVLMVMPQNPTHIMVHWVSGYANAKYVRILQEMTGAKVYYWMIDEACLAGGCHYPWDCEGYKTGCNDCPMTNSRIIKSTIRNNFQHKLRYIPKDAEVVLPTEMDRIRLEQSKIWKGHKWHKLLEIVNEDLFCPVDDMDAIKKEFNIPTDKRILLFGSSHLDEERKGMRVLIQALQKIDRDDVVCVVIGSQDILDISLRNIRLGRVDISTLAKLYRVADIFVCPSLEDSGPQMINQSIMCGTPVVAFEMGVAMDIVKTYETGYLAKWDDADDMAKGINQLLDMPKDKFLQMRMSCRELAVASFSRNVQNEFIKSLLK